MLENMLTEDGVLVSVDPFVDDEVDPFTAESVQSSPYFSPSRLERWKSNTSEVKKTNQTLDLRLGRSYMELAQLLTEHREFDFIYVDGNHASATVLADACMCFGMLKVGGIMLFDDYLWDHVPDWLARPKMSIDSFVNMFQPWSQQVISNYQLAIRRTK